MYRFGKHPAKSDYRTLRLKDYLKSIDAPPKKVDVLAEMATRLKLAKLPVETLFPMDGNDTYGDCTIAAIAHALTAFHGLIGKKHVPRKTTVTKLYFKLTGGVDSGLDPLTVVDYWRKNAVSDDKILAYAKINPRDHTTVKQAVRLFGGIYTGFQVQENCIEDFDNKKPWDVGRLTNNGHMVQTVAYDSEGVTLLTWGNTQRGTWAWWDECVDEAYAILPPEAKVSGFTTGFNFAQLKEDLSLITG